MRTAAKKRKGSEEESGKSSQEDKVRMVIDVACCSHEQAELALQKVDGDVDRAVGFILEGGSDDVSIVSLLHDMFKDIPTERIEQVIADVEGDFDEARMELDKERETRNHVEESRAVVEPKSVDDRHEEIPEFVPQEEKVDDKVSAMMLHFPDISRDVCELLIDDVNGNVEAAMNMAREMEEAYRELHAFQDDQQRHVESLARRFTTATRVHILACLEASKGNVEMAAEFLMDLLGVDEEDGSDMSANAPPTDEDPEDGVMILDEDDEGTSCENASVDLDGDDDGIESVRSVTGCTREDAERALELVEGDVNRAVNIIMEGSLYQVDIVGLLHSMFQAVPRQKIEQIIADNNGSFDDAELALERELTENPPLEDLVRAIRPDIPIDQVRLIVIKGKGDQQRTFDMADEWKVPESKVPARKMQKPEKDQNQTRKQVKPDKKVEVNRQRGRILTIDLHGFHKRQAMLLVQRVILNSRNEGDVSRIRFITGKGLHSRIPLQPVLRPLVLDLCRQLGCQAKLDPQNTGVVVCDI